MVALQAHAGDSDRPKNESMKDALASLEQSLETLDASDSPPHIGARLQEVIELVTDEINSRSS